MALGESTNYGSTGASSSAPGKPPNGPSSPPRPGPVAATMPSHAGHMHRLLRMNKAAAEVAAGGPAAPSRQERIQTLCRAYAHIARAPEGKLWKRGRASRRRTRWFDSSLDSEVDYSPLVSPPPTPQQRRRRRRAAACWRKDGPRGRRRRLRRRRQTKKRRCWCSTWRRALRTWRPSRRRSHGGA